MNSDLAWIWEFHKYKLLRLSLVAHISILLYFIYYINYIDLTRYIHGACKKLYTTFIVCDTSIYSISIFLNFFQTNVLNKDVKEWYIKICSPII